ncbi:MAG: lysine 5,6-aminomutase subunit alpha, partial [Bacteroidales bacterium]|nr:lysine 5,6-aminomutase subunit alpha [Bacteroidales bacterium]
MKESKLGLDFKKIDYAKQIARNISKDVQTFVDSYSTVAVERTLCRLMGIDGVDSNEVPLPNVLVDFIQDKGMLKHGVLFLLGNAIITTGLTPQQIAQKTALNELDITTLPLNNEEKAKQALQPYINQSIERIANNRKKRENFIA